MHVVLFVGAFLLLVLYFALRRALPCPVYPGLPVVCLWTSMWSITSGLLASAQQTSVLLGNMGFLTEARKSLKLSEYLTHQVFPKYGRTVSWIGFGKHLVVTQDAEVVKAFIAQVRLLPLSSCFSIRNGFFNHYIFLTFFALLQVLISSVILLIFGPDFVTGFVEN
jgi:hypothetical protein